MMLQQLTVNRDTAGSRQRSWHNSRWLAAASSVRRSGGDHKMNARFCGGIAALLLSFGIVSGAGAGPTLDKVAERGKLAACTSVENRPFGFLGTDGKPAGFHVDLITNIKDRLAKKLGKAIE